MTMNRAQTLVGWRVVCGFLLLLVSEIAHVGQLHIQKTGLEELIRRSAVIVIAEPDDPPTVEERVAIKASGKKPPPYVRIVHRYRVRESLRGDLTPGAAIAVIPADDALHERLHRDYYTKGLSRHVSVKHYEPVVAYVPDQPRILFLSSNGERYVYTVAGGTEGLARRSEVERLLGQKSSAAGETREAMVDRALRRHGDFGAYGDLRMGLAEIAKDCSVRLTDAENGIQVRIVPRDGHGHEFHFVVTAAGSIDDLMVGESMAAVPPVPTHLVFQYDNLRLVRQGNSINLTIEPVWRDAQRGPPPDFELGGRTYVMSAEDFASVWAELNPIDFAHYAQLTDADFEPLPPDLRYFERLHYSVNGKEIVSWGRSDQWLRPELRAPLQQIAARLTRWADEQPAPLPGDFRRVMLRDVEGLNGGQNVYVYSDGRLIVQRVLPAQGNNGLQERRYAWTLDAKQIDEMKQALTQHRPRELDLSRPGVPGEVYVEIGVLHTSGARVTMRQWADGAQKDFGALHAHLLRYAREAEKRKPAREGKYDPDWRPE